LIVSQVLDLLNLLDLVFVLLLGDMFKVLRSQNVRLGLERKNIFKSVQKDRIPSNMRKHFTGVKHFEKRKINVSGELRRKRERRLFERCNEGNVW